MPRIIFHIDVNSAFLSWTAGKMVREGKPDIRLVGQKFARQQQYEYYRDKLLTFPRKAC